MQKEKGYFFQRRCMHKAKGLQMQFFVYLFDVKEVEIGNQMKFSAVFIACPGSVSPPRALQDRLLGSLAWVWGQPLLYCIGNVELTVEVALKRAVNVSSFVSTPSDYLYPLHLLKPHLLKLKPKHLDLG